MRWSTPSCLSGLVALAVSACGHPAAAPFTWTTVDPAEAGMDASRLATLRPTVESGRFGTVHALLVARRGRLVYEEYFTGEDESLGTPLGVVEMNAETLHDVRSVSKSVTATLVGIAVDRGEIPSADTPLAELLPRHRDLLDGDKEAITLRHVLSMSAGIEWNEDTLSYANPRNDERRLSASDDPTAFVLSRPVIAPPDARFQYSGGMTHLLGAVLVEATGRDLEGYAREVLMEPLGIHTWEWRGIENAQPSAYAGVRLRGRDLLKLGQLYLDGGVWDGRRIVSAEWIDASTRPRGPGPEPDSDAPDYVLSDGYGYQWWWNEFATPWGPVDVATAVGNGGQRIIVIPRLELVMAVLAGDYNDPRFGWAAEDILMEFVVPSIDTGSDTADAP